ILQVTYQGCQEDGVCYPPIVRHVDRSTLAITDPEERGAGTVAAQWSAASDQTSMIDIAIASDSGGLVAGLLREGGVILLLGSFLLFGVGLAFTPCVFPMYPILAGAIAREGE